MIRALRHASLLSLSLLLLSSASAQAQPLRKRARLGDEETRAQRVLDLLGPRHILREAHRTTRRYFYDRSMNGVDWDAVLERYTPEADRARTPAELHAVVNRMLGELQTSHLGLLGYSVWDRELAAEFGNRLSVRGGFELVELDGGFFVAGVAEGGPAEAAGLLEGDEVLSLDGVAPSKSGLLEDSGHDPGLPGPHGYVLGVRRGDSVSLSIRRRRGEEPTQVTLKAAPMSLIQATKNSVRVIERDGVKIGVIHLWHFIHMEIFRTLRRALGGALAQVDVLVLDLRGRGGSAAVVAASLGLFSGRRPAWTRPVLCLTDRGTRSAKEIFAYHWKLRELGPIVGETTQGACIGCAFRQLSDGSVLMIPVQDVRRMTRGTMLEGVGVAPDVQVDVPPLPYRQGHDAILEAGLLQAVKLGKVQLAVPF